MAATRIAKIKTPRVGSTAKACTDVNTPERTRKVPTRLSENVVIASSTAQPFMASRRSTTRIE